MNNTTKKIEKNITELNILKKELKKIKNEIKEAELKNLYDEFFRIDNSKITEDGIKVTIPNEYNKYNELLKKIKEKFNVIEEKVIDTNKKLSKILIKTKEAQQENERVKEIIESFHLTIEKAKELDKLLTNIINAESNAKVEELFTQVNDYISGFGVEVIRLADEQIDKYWYDTAFLYINMGDTYDTTILYDTENNEIIISDWGSIVEENSNKYA